jgi:hypothetical protein
MAAVEWGDYGGAQVLFRADSSGLAPVPMGPDRVDEHDHPESYDTTIYDLGTGAEEFECECVCPNPTEFGKFAARRRVPTSWGGKTWSMTFKPGTAKRSASGVHYVQARFKQV